MHDLVLKKLEEIKELLPAANYKGEKSLKVLSSIAELEKNLHMKEEIVPNNSQIIKKFSDLNECMPTNPTILSESCKKITVLDKKNNNLYASKMNDYDFIEVVNETSFENKENNYYTNNSKQNSERKVSKKPNITSGNKFKCKFTSEKVLSSKSINFNNIASMKSLTKNS